MSLGDRVRSVRKRRGINQRELARLSGVSLSLIRKLEQGERDETRVETLRRLAVTLGVPTTALLPTGDDLGQHESEPEARWGPVREAILHPCPRDTPDPVNEQGLSEALTAAVKLYHDNRYGDLARALPELLSDGEDAPPPLRSRIQQLAGSVMVQTHQHEAARVALERSLAEALQTGSELDGASAIITICWLLLSQRRFDQATRLATEWADRVEPRFSTARISQMSIWGWLLLRGSAAAIRDNRPGEAADMMRLAEAAAVAAGGERGSYHMYWTTFGPATVAMKRVENAVIDGRPDVALRLADRVPPGLRPTSDNRNRHLLDVSAAHLELRHHDEALDVLYRLSAESGPWLAQQRTARDQVSSLIHRRRTLTSRMRELADAVNLPL